MTLLALLLTASPDSLLLPNIPHVPQKPDFCGEACVETALKHFGRPGTQDDVFAAAEVAPELGRGAWTPELKHALERLGFGPGPTWFAISPDRAEAQMQLQLNAALADLRLGFPSILCMHYDADRGSPEHFRLLVGYEDAGETLVFEDPAVGRTVHIRRERLFELWPLKYHRDEWTLVRMRLAPTREAELPRSDAARYAQHVLAARARYGDSLDGLTPRIEAPFIVWSESRRDGAGTVRWAVNQLEADFFAGARPALQDVFLFDGAQSYESHAKALFGETPETPFGYASSKHHALVMNIATGGGTLVHEMVHPYVAAAFDDAPSWFNEGLASLFEQCGEDGGHIVGYTNWRLAGLQSAIRRGQADRLSTLAAMNEARFRDDDEALHYAEARYLMLYLQEHGLLRSFVARARATQDPQAALREAVKLDTLDGDWRKWVLTLRFE
jgi:hypothetical protein